jgi:hypothetical protein
MFVSDIHFFSVPQNKPEQALVNEMSQFACQRVK